MGKPFNEKPEKKSAGGKETIDPTIASPYEQPGFWEEIGLEPLSREELEKR